LIPYDLIDLSRRLEGLVELEHISGLNVRLFGRFDVRIKGKRPKGITERRAHELFAYLLVNHHNKDGVAIATIAESVYHGKTNSVAKAQTALRKVMKSSGYPHILANSLKGSGPGAGSVPQLKLDASRVDLLLFNKLIRKNDHNSLREGVSRYRGHLLEDFSARWVVPFRKTCFEQLIKAVNRINSEDIAEDIQRRAWGRHLRRLIILRPPKLLEFECSFEMASLHKTARNHYRGYLLALAKARRFQLALREYRSLLRVLDSAGISIDESLSEVETSIRDQEHKFRNLNLRSDLRRFLTRYYHRWKDSEQIARLFHTHHLVTLTGMGGIGKTRLAVGIAKDIEEDFFHRVIFISLAEVLTPNRVAGHVAFRLGVPVTNNPTDALVEALKDKHILLILDNCEHVVEETAALVTALIEKCDFVKILVTGRNSLHVQGEEPFPVKALTYPAPGERYDPVTLKRFSAVEFLVNRMAELGGVDPTQTESEAVVFLCQKLGGIPLGLCQAAGLAARRGIREVAKLLGEGQPLPVISGQDKKDRSQDDSLAWGYDILGPAERILLRNLSVFRGGWDADALHSVCGNDSISIPEIDRAQEVLRQCSWIEPGVSRNRLLEPVREFAYRKLSESGSLGTLNQNHFDYFREFAKVQMERFWGADFIEVLTSLSAQRDNLVAALEWGLTWEKKAGAQLCVILCPFWIAHQEYEYGASWISRYLEARTDEFAGIEADLWTGLGNLNYFRSDHDGSIEACKKALEVASHRSDLLAICHLQLGVCTLFRDAGKGEQETEAARRKSRRLIKESIAEADKSGISWIRALARSNYAFATVFALHTRPRGIAKKDIEEALAFSTQGLELARSTKNPWFVGQVLVNHGIVVKYAGGASTDCHSEALHLRLRIGDTFGMLQCLERLAENLVDEHRLHDAAKVYGFQKVLNEDWRVRLAIHNAKEHNERISVLHSSLGEEVFLDYEDVGRQMSGGEILRLVGWSPPEGVE
jgi:predicted ATPase